MTEARTILHEENPISLRSAFVLDDGYKVTFQLLPRCTSSDLPSPRKYSKSDFTYLFRRRRSFFARVTLAPLGSAQEKTFRWSLPSGMKRGFWGLIGHLGYRRLSISLENDSRR